MIKMILMKISKSNGADQNSDQTFLFFFLSSAADRFGVDIVPQLVYNQDMIAEEMRYIKAIKRKENV